MADETAENAENTETTETKEAVVAPPSVTKADLDAMKSEFGASLAALTDTVRGALTAQQTPKTVSGDVATTIPPQFAAILRQNGYTDADIKANAPVILPWFLAMLQTDGQVMMGGIKQVDDKVALLEMAEDADNFPYFKEVAPKVRSLRKAAEKEGRYLTPADAYQAAVAADISSPESRIDAARARIKAAASSSSSADLSANSSLSHQGSRPGQGAVRRTALTGEELAALPRAERKKYFEQIGDLPIK